MKIDGENYEVGNRAMASVLLFYYHVISDNGFTDNGQTCSSISVGIQLEHLIDASCEENEVEIDAQLVREGSVIAVLCDLSEAIDNYPEDYWLQPYVNHLCSILKGRRFGDVPEVEELLLLVEERRVILDYSLWNSRMKDIYIKYILGRWKNLGRGSAEHNNSCHTTSYKAQ